MNKNFVPIVICVIVLLVVLIVLLARHKKKPKNSSVSLNVKQNNVKGTANSTCIVDTTDIQNLISTETALYNSTILPFFNTNVTDPNLKAQLTTAQQNFVNSSTAVLAQPLCSSLCTNGTISQNGNVAQCRCNPGYMYQAGTGCVNVTPIAQGYLNQIQTASNTLNTYNLTIGQPPSTCTPNQQCGFDSNNNPCGGNNGQCPSGSGRICNQGTGQCIIKSCKVSSDCGEIGFSCMNGQCYQQG
jgi:hypothetical protein